MIIAIEEIFHWVSIILILLHLCLKPSSTNLLFSGVKVNQPTPNQEIGENVSRDQRKINAGKRTLV